MGVLMVIAMQAAASGGLSVPLRMRVTANPEEPCRGTGDEVVVCGGRDDRYRLPLRREREPANPTHAAGEGASTMAALTPTGRCGLFAGERHCSKVEAADYGYGRGRDPVTLARTLAGKLLSPESEP